MELNQPSPSPTSPMPETDGEDLCRIEVTDMAVDAVTLLVSLCGLVGNGAIIRLLSSRIRRNAITVYISHLAIANFSFLLIMAVSSLIYIVENISCSALVFLNFKRSFLLFSLFSYNISFYLLTAISIEGCMSIHCSSIRRPQRLSFVVCAVLWAFSIAVIATVTSLCLYHKHEHCRVALISMYALNFLIFAPLMVISTTILFIKVQCGSQQRHPRRLYIVIFLTVLFFLLFALPLSIWNFLQQFNYMAMPSQVIFLLACINSSINPFIYFLVGSCQRHCSLVSLHVAFQRVFEVPEYYMACSNNIMMDALDPA